MSTFHPPVVSMVTPRIYRDAENRPVPTTKRQAALYKYMRPLDRGVNVYVLSDGSVQTDLSVPLSNGEMSTTELPYPDMHMGGFSAGRTAGPPEGAEGGPFGPPPPYAVVMDNITATRTEYVLDPYLVYYFLGGRDPYPDISTNLVAILTAAHFDNYIS